MVKKNSQPSKKRKSKSNASIINNSNPLPKCIPLNGDLSITIPRDEPPFNPLKLEVLNPDTAILLLGSSERPVLLAAAAALADYGSRSHNDFQRLLDLRIMESVLGLVRHEELITRRFALKLLALMSAAPNARIRLLDDATDWIAFFVNMLEEETDVFLQEFASRILAELTSEPDGAAKFIGGQSDGSVFFLRIKAEDPDVKKNSIEVIDNLLKDIDGINFVFGSKEFNFEAIYGLLNEPYAVIQQLALNVLELLVMHSADERVQESFRQSEGPRRLLDILENREWNDLYTKVLNVLYISCVNEKTAELLNSTGGTKRLFSFVETAFDAAMKYQALNILVRLAEDMNGKKILHGQGFIAFLSSCMDKSQNSETRATVCQGFAKMTQYPPAAVEIVSEDNLFDYILHLLNDEEAKWSERETAALSLKELFESDFQNCVNFIDNSGIINLTHIIKLPTTSIPWEIKVTIIQALSAMASNTVLLEDLIDFDLLSALCSHLEIDNNTNDELRIAICHVLGRFAISAQARNLMIRANLPCRMHSLLTSLRKVPMLSALIQLLLVLANDRDFAQLCHQLGFLFFMLKEQSMSRVITCWRTCVETLLAADLSMKFAYMGRLSLLDVTTDGFHALRHCFCPFPTLEDLFRLKLCPLQPIYVANFGDLVEDQEFHRLSTKCAAFNAARENMRRESLERGVRVSEATINAWLELKFGRLQPDPDLVTCLENLKAEIATAALSEDCGCCSENSKMQRGKLIPTTRITLRAKVLASFVARRLSGIGPKVCLDEQLELHLHKLRERLETNVIPIGLLRVGSHLERAFLFKVLADRIGLPASLVRGNKGRSWIEIAVPAGCEICTSEEYLPARYLRENFIIDLVDQVGELVPLESCTAERYQESRPSCGFTCCEDKKKK